MLLLSGLRGLGNHSGLGGDLLLFRNLSRWSRISTRVIWADGLLDRDRLMEKEGNLSGDGLVEKEGNQKRVGGGLPPWVWAEGIAATPTNCIASL